MIDDLIERIKQMYHQLEHDEARLERLKIENSKFGVLPSETGLAEPPVPGLTSPPGPQSGEPAPVSPETAVSAPPPSLLDLIGRFRGNI